MRTRGRSSRMTLATLTRFSKVFSTRPSGMSSARRQLTLRMRAASSASQARSSTVPRVPISPCVRSRMAVRRPRSAILSSVPPQVCSTSSRWAAMARMSKCLASGMKLHSHRHSDSVAQRNDGCVPVPGVVEQAIQLNDAFGVAVRLGTFRELGIAGCIGYIAVPKRVIGDEEPALAHASRGHLEDTRIIVLVHVVEEDVELLFALG